MRQRFLLLLLLTLPVLAQDTLNGKFAVDVNYFYGNIVPHRKSIQHLITAHPEGIIIGFSRKTFGNEKWQERYNYPDHGFSFHYQDMKNRTLGEMYGLYGHYNFYFLNRHLMFRVGQGVAYNTNPYDKETNFRNYAYGVHLMPSTYFMLNFTSADIWQGFGVQAGLSFIHHSNASMKAPNTSTNTFAANVGLNYTFGRSEEYRYVSVKDTVSYSEPIKYTVAFRGGINQSDIIGTKQYPYYALSLFADKRWSRKSAFQFGADIFWPKYLKEYIRYKSVAYPEEHVDGKTDYRKVGLFVGHELFVNSLSLETQVGYYVYAPFNSTGNMYQRVGMKYYINSKLFAGVALKTHAAKAEVMEFSIGARL